MGRTIYEVVHVWEEEHRNVFSMLRASGSAG